MIEKGVPMPSVGVDYLKFDKMGGVLPVVFSNALHIAVPTERAVALESLTEDCASAFAMHGILPMADCDGDACFAFREELPEQALLDTTLRPDSIEHLCWKEGNDTTLYAKAGDMLLIPTVLVDMDGDVLGVAYSSKQSLRENFTPKSIAGTHDTINPVVLYSRKRGIWPKGLKNPNEDKNAPLPTELPLSSGDYLLFMRLKTNERGTAVLIQAEVPEGHGFCHEKYLFGPDKKWTSVYFDDRAAPPGAKPYRSCFHRVVLP